jgi:hypothetical protein
MDGWLCDWDIIDGPTTLHDLLFIRPLHSVSLSPSLVPGWRCPLQTPCLRTNSHTRILRRYHRPLQCSAGYIGRNCSTHLHRGGVRSLPTMQRRVPRTKLLNCFGPRALAATRLRPWSVFRKFTIPPRRKEDSKWHDQMHTQRG